MKKLLTLLAVSATILTSACARPVDFEWDPQSDATSFNIYIRADESKPWVKVGTSTTNQFVGYTDYPDTEFEVAVNATAGTGPGAMEGPLSDVLRVNVTPGKVTGTRVLTIPK